jgi:hypothetical protein
MQVISSCNEEYVAGWLPVDVVKIEAGDGQERGRAMTKL